MNRSSAYLNSQLVLLKWDSGLDLTLLKEGEFMLLSSEAVQANSTQVFDVSLDEPYSLVHIKLVIKRKTIFYINKIVLPYFVFYIVTAFTYALPVEAGEKKSYSTSILISAMIYLKDISDYIPKTSILPLLTIYFNLNLILVFVCVLVTTLVYMIYYYDKLKVALPNCIKRIIASSKYFRSERHFAANHKLFSSNEVRSSLATINKQLTRVNRNLRKCESYLFSLQAAGNSNDYLANEMLSLVITLKIFIRNHSLDSAAHPADPDPDQQPQPQPVSCSGLSRHRRKANKHHHNVIHKLTAIDQKRLGNFHYINTLENLKLNLVKLRAAERYNLSFRSNELVRK